MATRRTRIVQEAFGQGYFGQTYFGGEPQAHTPTGGPGADLVPYLLGAKRRNKRARQREDKEVLALVAQALDQLEQVSP